MRISAGERETHDPPKELNERLLRIGGRTFSGKPLFRIVWAGSRYETLEGKWGDNGPICARVVPKYDNPNRWVLEKYQPPEAYGSPKDWEAENAEYIDGIRCQTLGPYPSDGDYEALYVVETWKRDERGKPQSQFSPLTPKIIEFVIAMVERCKGLKVSERKAMRAEAREKRQKEIDQQQDDILDNATPAFYGESFVSLSGKRKEAACLSAPQPN